VYVCTGATAPPCCCASIDIKMNWVIDVQKELRLIDPRLTLGGVNIDIENIGECNKVRALCVCACATGLGPEWCLLAAGAASGCRPLSC
jgi:hypothetical protein